MEFTFCLGLHSQTWRRIPGLFPSDATLFYSFNTASTTDQYWPSCYTTRWDSGGFTRLQYDGSWDACPEEVFVPRVKAICRGVARVDGFAIQDWMCEPQIINGLVRKATKRKRPPKIDPLAWLTWAEKAGSRLTAAVEQAKALGEFDVIFHGTGLSVEEHQARTVQSYIKLRRSAPEVPWFPVLQGWTESEYMDCWRMYQDAGVELRELPIVAIGSTCRRNATAEVEDLVKKLYQHGFRNLHMLGMKTDGLRRCARYIKSSDSMAWSMAAWKKHIVLPGCQHGTKKWQPKLNREEFGNCANCPKYARQWYDKQIALVKKALATTSDV